MYGCTRPGPQKNRHPRAPATGRDVVGFEPVVEEGIHVALRVRHSVGNAAEKPTDRNSVGLVWTSVKPADRLCDLDFVSGRAAAEAGLGCRTNSRVNFVRYDDRLSAGNSSVNRDRK